MASVSSHIGWTALVLSGGRGSRLGHDDKAAITIGGTSALDHLLSCLPEHVPVVVSGPQCPTHRPVTFRRERPIHGGPVAGIASGLEAVSTPVIALLAVDMPWAGPLVERLIGEFASVEAEALVPVDASGFRQPLCAVLRTEAVREAVRRLGDPAGRSLRDLMSLIDVRERPLTEAEGGWVDDIDTPEDLRTARSAPERSRGGAPSPWTKAVCAALNLPAGIGVDVMPDGMSDGMPDVMPDVMPDIDLILDVARVSAHNVQPAAAPISTFLLGAAVAGGTDIAEAAARIQALAVTWPTPE